ncbi:MULTISPECIES: divalent metal ion exporter adaptor subunit IhpB [Rhodopseudomonas]|uniref:Hemolysin D n=1 Tax=Rhodopseudomonas palustris TaxID=1076 RepID=A0A0D7EWW0_RHOPL|nr:MULTISPECIES: efflux RND transporter periplasmic adaptor subunit [Rhodopseudomonas]KIZ45278.1 hemolysin D [Rhodopseudomonas palustris]MDF3811002.1 efflux RND transporter periplasmic adaptor subunit [Rhodopseudomonas sp. BAL398]WOK15901.1 efflux RND transporter periplasmic adaptor subunit [Rhodopseudomonas sp. BAL398]
MKTTSKAIVAVVAALAAIAGVYAFAPSGSLPNPAKPGHAESEHGHEAKEGHRDHDDHDSDGVAMSDAKAAAAGIEILAASSATLRDALKLNGVLQPNQETLVQVTPRFAGVVRDIRKRIGDQVEKGELLAKIESNQSLTVYDIRAPISGTVIARQISLGEYASEQKPAFTVADLSTVWVDLSVYRRDLPRVKLGDTVIVDVGDGGEPIESQLSYISPIGSSDTQSALARAVLPNPGMRLRAGLFVSARLVLSANDVAVAVRSEALQTLENRSVVFVRHGDKFEAREVEIGARDPEQVEIVSGLSEGDRYAAKNSFIVKAELSKGSASHEH